MRRRRCRRPVAATSPRMGSTWLPPPSPRREALAFTVAATATHPRRQMGRHPLRCRGGRHPRPASVRVHVGRRAEDVGARKLRACWGPHTAMACAGSFATSSFPLVAGLVFRVGGGAWCRTLHRPSLWGNPGAARLRLGPPLDFLSRIGAKRRTHFRVRAERALPHRFPFTGELLTPHSAVGGPRRPFEGKVREESKSVSLVRD